MKAWAVSIVSLVMGAAVSAVAVLGPAQASSTPLEAWKVKAGAQLSEAMTSPRIPPIHIRRGPGDVRHIVDLVVDRDGQVLNATLIRARGHKALKRSTEACIQKLGRLPALPASLNGERFKVRMHLIYANSAEGVKRMTADAQREQRRQLRALKVAAEEEGPRVIQLVASQ